MKRQKREGKEKRSENADSSVLAIPKKSREEPAIQRLVEAGLLRPATKPWRMPRFTARPIRGPSIVQTIREERDDS
jgi:hypothetical protein